MPALREEARGDAAHRDRRRVRLARLAPELAEQHLVGRVPVLGVPLEAGALEPLDREGAVRVGLGQRQAVAAQAAVRRPVRGEDLRDVVAGLGEVARSRGARRRRRTRHDEGNEDEAAEGDRRACRRLSARLERERASALHHLPFHSGGRAGAGGEASLPSSVSAPAAVATPRIAAGPLLRNRARPPPGLRYTVVRRCAARRIALGHENRRMLL